MLKRRILARLPGELVLAFFVTLRPPQTRSYPNGNVLCMPDARQPSKKDWLMRLVIDLQGAQTESHKRGIGRYSQSVEMRSPIILGY